MGVAKREIMPSKPRKRAESETEKREHREMEMERPTLPPDLLLRVKFFIRDLLAFQSDEGARHRLADDPTAELYMSSAYFLPEEAHMLLQAPPPSPSASGEASQTQTQTQTQTLTLRQAIQETLLHKAQRGDHGVCTSHDLAPIIQRWFDVRKGFQDNPTFRKELKRFLRTYARSHPSA